MPVLANLLVQVHGGQLSLTGTDLEVEMISRVAVDDAGAGYAGLRHLLALRPSLIEGLDEYVPDLTLAFLNEATQAWVEHEYNRTRHTVGEECVRLLAERHGAPLKAGRDNALIGEARFGSGVDADRVVLAFPLSHLRRSESVAWAVGASAAPGSRNCIRCRWA